MGYRGAPVVVRSCSVCQQCRFVEGQDMCPWMCAWRIVIYDSRSVPKCGPMVKCWR